MASALGTARRQQSTVKQATKAFSAPRGLVPRARLVERLLAAQDAVLALIVAPPGYGKSTLLRDWEERDPRPFVWFKLGDRAVRLSPRALARAVDDVGRRNSRFVIVIDDAHAVSGSLVHRSVTRVLSELPPGATIAVASRTEPSLPIGRLRAHRALVELRMGDLAMTEAEASELLKGAGLPLERDAVRELVRETEGWPAALYLAALSLRGGPGEQPPGRFAGDDHLLSEFLRDEVLATVPPDLVGFLMRTAVLDELSGPVCDEVLEERGSALALERLEQTSQLLVPLDRAHARFRWQRLFGEALRAELRRTEPDAEPRLQLRASKWFARHGDVDRAIDHAAAARDVRRTGELLWSNLLAYLANGRTERVEQWLSSFSEDEIAGHGPLALCAAHVALVSGHLDLARHWAVVAAGALERGPKRSRSPSAGAGVAVIHALLARGGAEEMRNAALRAYEVEPDDSPWRPVLCMLRGVAEHLLGEREAATAMLERGVDLSSATAPSVASLCLAVSTMIAIEAEDWEAADELAARARGLVMDAGLAGYPISALVLAASAAVRAHQGRADEAKRDLSLGVELLTELGDYIPWYGAEARILLAHASLWLADVVGARTLLAEASRLARRMPDAIAFSCWFDRAWAYMDTLAESSLAGPSSLTIAELRILRFLPSHRSFREIAAQLGVSANTVKTQAHAVYRKLGAASRSEAVARAAEAGLLGQ